MTRNEIEDLMNLPTEVQQDTTLTISAADYISFTRASRRLVDEFPGGAPMGGARFLDNLVKYDPNA